MLPYPRYFADSYSLKVDEEVISKEVLQSERITAFLFGKERKEVDAYHNPHSMGHRYTDGIDIYGNEFKDHQKTMGCPMGFIKKIFSPKEDK